MSFAKVGYAQESLLPLPSSEIPSAQGVTNDYILGPGDEIQITVVGYTEFNDSYEILPDGNVMLPLVGAINLENKTPYQAKQEVTVRLQRYLVEPMVTIRLLELRPVVVSVAGAVHRPGPISLNNLESSNNNNNSSSPTLSTALLAAGGVTREADLRAVTIRRPQVGGQVEDITVNLWEAVALQADGTINNIVLRDGDTVVVPELSPEDVLDRRLLATSSLAPNTIRVRVVGEVSSPGEVEVSPDSSVSGAVAAAGGPTSDARLQEVALIRLDDIGEVQQEVLDLSDLVDNYQVQDGDVVVVSKKGYVSFLDNLDRILSSVNLFRIFGF
ncbi:MAG: polysaccharide biosynthesis/export family protein [Cyanobacteria bacterium J06635_1]